MENQFSYYSSGFANDMEKIRLATSCLTGAAKTWWNADATHRTINTWPVFMAALQTRFRPVQASHKARMQLLAMKQERGQDLDAFINTFQQVMAHITDMAEADKVIQFKRALYSGLGNRVHEKDPQTLAEAIDVASSINGLFSGMGRDFTGRANTHSGGSSSSSGGGGTAMDLSNIDDDPLVALEDGGVSRTDINALVAAQVNAILSARVPSRAGRGGSSHSSGRRRDGYVDGLSSEVVAARIKNNQCIACGEAGHWKGECPKRGGKGKKPHQQGKE